MIMANKRILVAGIGNIFLGDDAFGCEVVKRLLQRELPPETSVVDFGIRGFDLAFALLEEYELSILVDAMPRGAAPGTLYVLQIDPEHVEEVETSGPQMVTHAMDPLRVLALVKSMGGNPTRILIVGCEPSHVSEQEITGLSEPVAAMLDKAVNLIESVIAKTIDREVVSNERALTVTPA
jgi:hydrogenase maturation protease